MLLVPRGARMPTLGLEVASVAPMATPEELVSAGLRTVSNSACEAAALDLGATVTRWRPGGQPDVLFLSREALVGAGDEIHGGIPLCAPWFGSGRDGVEVPHTHGLVRWVPWRLVSETSTGDATTLVWELHGDAVDHLPGATAYPSDIWFRHEVTFGVTLELVLTIGSPSSDFVLDAAFHTYFAVSDVRDTVIDGLSGIRYRDYMDEGRWHDSDGGLRLAGHTDRIYNGVPEVRITDADRVLTLRGHGITNTIVWNPGPEGADSLTGWAGDEWTRMVAVEVGNVQGNAVTVPAGGTHTMSMQVTARPRH